MVRITTENVVVAFVVLIVISITSYTLSQTYVQEIPFNSYKLCTIYLNYASWNQTPTDYWFLNNGTIIHYPEDEVGGPQCNDTQRKELHAYFKGSPI